MLLYKHTIPYIFGHKLNSGPNNNDNDNDNDNDNENDIKLKIASLQNKGLYGWYWFGDNNTIISIHVDKMEMNCNGFVFEYGVQEEDLKYGYHNVASVSTQIALDGQIKHIVNDKYDDCFKPGWHEFEKFFKFITGWPIISNKIKPNLNKSKK